MYLNYTILCADLEFPITVFDPTQQSDLLDAEFNEDFACNWDLSCINFFD